MPLINSKIDRLATIFCTCLVLIPTMGLTAFAQPSPEVEIDKIFRYDSLPSGSYGQIGTNSLKAWLGSYQRTIRDGDNYVVVFDRGSLSLNVELKDTGGFKSFTVGCPVTRSLPVSDAPEGYQKILSQCNKSKF
jgi:hypothetical protein